MGAGLSKLAASDARFSFYAPLGDPHEHTVVPRARDRVSRRDRPFMHAGLIAEHYGNGTIHTPAHHPKDSRFKNTPHARIAHGQQKDYGIHWRQQARAKIAAGADPRYWGVVLANS